jgi:hypothetical protein
MLVSLNRNGDQWQASAKVRSKEVEVSNPDPQGAIQAVLDRFKAQDGSPLPADQVWVKVALEDLQEVAHATA